MMTRAKLLARLRDMEASGLDMDLPLVVDLSTKVDDKRTRCGFRIVHTYGTVQYTSSLYLNNTPYGSIIADEIDV